MNEGVPAPYMTQDVILAQAQISPEPADAVGIQSGNGGNADAAAQFRRWARDLAVAAGFQYAQCFALAAGGRFVRIGGARRQRVCRRWQ